MPRIADSMEGMDVSLLDYGMWQKLDSISGLTSEHHEDHGIMKTRKRTNEYDLRLLADSRSNRYKSASADDLSLRVPNEPETDSNFSITNISRKP